MKKIILCTVSLFVVGFSVSSFAATLDAQTLTRALGNSAAKAADKSEFAIVYGGQDISRGSINLVGNAYKPVMIG